MTRDPYYNQTFIVSSAILALLQNPKEQSTRGQQIGSWNVVGVIGEPVEQCRPIDQ